MISSKQREKAFTKDFIKLLKKHDADLEIMDDCEHLEVTLYGKYEGTRTIKEFGQFKIRA